MNDPIPTPMLRIIVCLDASILLQSPVAVTQTSLFPSPNPLSPTEDNGFPTGDAAFPTANGLSPAGDNGFSSPDKLFRTENSPSPVADALPPTGNEPLATGNEPLATGNGPLGMANGLKFSCYSTTSRWVAVLPPACTRTA